VLFRRIIIAVVASAWSYAQPLTLTADEHHFLEMHPLSCVTTGLWPPFNTSINGKLEGIGIDYWHKITDKLGISFNCTEANSWPKVLKDIESKKFDVTIGAQKTEDRLKYSVFSEPLARYSYVAVSLKGINSELRENDVVAVGKSYSADNMLRKLYASFHIVETDSIEDALNLVKNGKAKAAVDVLPVMAYFLSKKQFGDLAISVRFPEKFSFRVMLRRDYASIMPLINKAINTILIKEDQIDIASKWESIRNKNSTFSKYMYGVMLGLLLALLLLFYVVGMMRKKLKDKDKDIKYYEELASFDSLTLIYNRHMLDTILAQQLAIAHRYRQLMSIVFFDIDDFKLINDKYGHNTGDDVLIELSRLVLSNIRGSDIFGRWGGDEFMIILPESSQKQAKRLVGVLDGLIREHTFSDVGHISCSFGVVSYQYGDNIKDILGRVDVKMYEAKKNKHRQK
jgi:polar amino acid transport system substrate-binding protein